MKVSASAMPPPTCVEGRVPWLRSQPMVPIGMPAPESREGVDHCGVSTARHTVCRTPSAT
jgi:hypothetical protein